MSKRILIVEVNWIGDVIFSTPFIRAVREAYPDAYIASLLHPRCAEILAASPRLDENIIYDEEGRHRSILGKLKLISDLRQKKFDTAFILHRSFTKALIATLAGARERIGYPTKRRSFLLTKTVEESDPGTHKVEYFLDIARAAGIKPQSTAYEFFINAVDRTSAGELLRRSGIKEGEPFIVLCPGGNWDPKRWPKENFAKTGDALSKEFGCRIVISGAAKDVALAEEIRALMKHPPVIICGKTTLKELAAIFERAALVIANDTGPMHLAVSMKAKTIALFGPTDYRLTGPYGPGNYRTIFKNEECEVPCYDLTCRENRCMSAIKVEDVLKAADEILKGRS